MQIDESVQGCMEGYYYQSSGCQKCSDQCKSCEKQAYNCTNCNDLQFRTLKQNGQIQTCSCKQNYFENPDKSYICLGCHSSCLSCQQPNDSLQCLSCNTSDTIQGNRQLKQISSYSNQSICKCKDGYYEDPLDNFCKKCHYSCKTCYSLSKCAECQVDATTNRTALKNGICECAEGYFDNGENLNCQKCPKQCKGCINQHECKDCLNPDIMGRYPILKDKLCSCKPGFYDNGYSISCQQCPNNCLLCTSFNTCLECDSNQNRIIDANNGSCQCKEGYYDKGNTKLACIKCPYNCKTCNSNGDCINCPDQNQFHRKDFSNSNTCNCIQGYYDNGISQECQKCDDNCLECSQKGKCIKCISNKLNNFSGLVDNQGACLCIEGYYLNNSTMVCVKCPYYCKTCVSGKECLSCDQNQINNRQNIDQSLKCECKEGYYDDGANLVCKKCAYNCKTCDIRGCTQCSEENNRISIQKSKYCQCQEGFYDNQEQPECKKCPFNCLTCNNKGECLTCDNKKNRKNIQLSSNCECKEGFYEDKSNRICQKCSPLCLTCVSLDVCTSCNDKVFRIFDQKTNKCLCQEGFYEDNISKECKKCHEFCKNCTGPSENQCNDCFEQDNRVLNSTNCVCKPETDDKGIKLCQMKCHYSCSTCFGKMSNQCNSCGDINLTFRQINQNKQTCDCLNGYYEVTNQQVCKKCHDSCQTCFNGTQNGCSSCQLTSFRKFDKQINQCPCILGYFENTQTGKCEKCHNTCKQCFGSSNNQCSSCEGLFLKRVLNEKYECQCKQNYQEEDGICKLTKEPICNLSCLFCSEDDSEICYQCKQGFILDLNSSKCKCKDGDFYDLQTNSCLPCNQNCLTCKEKQDKCLTCKQDQQLNQQSDKCQTQVFPTNIPKEVIQQVYNVTESSTYVSVGATAGGSILLSMISPNGNLVSQFLSIQKLNLILLVELALPELLYIFFKAVGGNSPLNLMKNINLLNKYLVQDSKGEQLQGKFNTEEIASSIYINAGGVVTIIIIVFIIFIPSLLLYKNNTLIQSSLHQYSLFAMRSKKIYENIVSSALVQIHEIVTLVVYFSTNTQILALFQFGNSDSFFLERLVLTIFLKLYFGIIYIISYQILNNKGFIQRNRYKLQYHSFDEIQQSSSRRKLQIWLEIIFKHMKQDLIEDQGITRNFKLVYQIIENIIIPSSIIFFYFNYKLQIGLSLFFQLILLIISIKYRPYKQFINNFNLILDQICWVSIYISILILGKRINILLSSSNQIANEDINIIDKISWVIMIFCLIILFFNPVFIMIKLIGKIPLIVQKIKNIVVQFKIWKKNIQDQIKSNKKNESFESAVLQQNKLSSEYKNVCSISIKRIQDKQLYNQKIAFSKQKTLEMSILSKFNHCQNQTNNKSPNQQNQQQIILDNNNDNIKIN